MTTSTTSQTEWILLPTHVTNHNLMYACRTQWDFVAEMRTPSLYSKVG